MRRFQAHFVGGYPAILLGLFFIGPLALMLGVSFFERDPMAFFNPAFQFENYEKFTSKRVIVTTIRSLTQASMAAALVGIKVKDTQDLHCRPHGHHEFLLVLCEVQPVCLKRPQKLAAPGALDLALHGVRELPERIEYRDVVAGKSLPK